MIIPNDDSYFCWEVAIIIPKVDYRHIDVWPHHNAEFTAGNFMHRHYIQELLRIFSSHFLFKSNGHRKNEFNDFEEKIIADKNLSLR